MSFCSNPTTATRRLLDPKLSHSSPPTSLSFPSRPMPLFQILARDGRVNDVEKTNEIQGIVGFGFPIDWIQILNLPGPSFEPQNLDWQDPRGRACGQNRGRDADRQRSHRNPNGIEPIGVKRHVRDGVDLWV